MALAGGDRQGGCAKRVCGRFGALLRVLPSPPQRAPCLALPLAPAGQGAGGFGETPQSAKKVGLFPDRLFAPSTGMATLRPSPDVPRSIIIADRRRVVKDKSCQRCAVKPPAGFTARAGVIKYHSPQTSFASGGGAAFKARPNGPRRRPPDAEERGKQRRGGAPRPAQGAHGAKPRASTPAASPRRQRARRGRENRGGGDAPRDGRAPAQGPGNKGPPWRNKDGRRPQPERGAETPRDRPARAHTSAVPVRAHPARAGPAARWAPRGAVSTHCRLDWQCRRRAGGCSAPQPLERKRRGCAQRGARK